MRTIVIIFSIICSVITLTITCTQKSSQVRIIEDHKNITGNFKEARDVTKTCLICHDDAGNNILKTRHWKWLGAETLIRSGRRVPFGKINQINNFCIALTSNWPRCTSCHIGYGFKDKNFNFKNKENIDCLVCHDTTGTYQKHPALAGLPVKEETTSDSKKYLPPDYLTIARSAGKTSRRSCGSCHFYGGGGDAVKHGNMDSGLLQPEKSMDIHMGGHNFTCTRCHKQENHQIKGTLHGVHPGSNNHFGCMDCHNGKIHKNKIIDNHLPHVLCQTCHIPKYAVSLPTKIWWDWSTAGKDIKPQEDEFGIPDYDKKKGSFKRGKNLIPEYLWFNGNQEAVIQGDKVKSPSGTVFLNSPEGKMKDRNSKIAPFKLMAGRQPFDKKTKYFIIPKLFGEGGFWKTFDWDKSFTLGMKEAGLKYSGDYGWIETVMFWPINHMVPPAEKSLKCIDCHGPKGRLDWKKLGYKGDPKKTGGRF